MHDLYVVTLHDKIINHLSIEAMCDTIEEAEEYVAKHTVVSEPFYDYAITIYGPKDEPTADQLRAYRNEVLARNM